MRALFQNILLSAYRIVFVRGLLRFEAGRRVFFFLYELYKRLFEAGPVEALRPFVPASGLVIDVGANIGFFTLRFAQWVGAGGKVIAIEPEEINYQELTRRCTAHGLSGIVEARQALVDSTSGTRHLVVNPDHPGDHRLGETGLAMPAVSIDDLRAQSGRPVAFIKIDVQGAEARVLAGASKTLAQDHPSLFVEIDPAALKSFGTGSTEILRTLGDLGYQPHELHAGSAPTALTDSQYHDIISRRGYTDFLFLATANKRA